jgi:hydrogenase-4 component F
MNELYLYFIGSFVIAGLMFFIRTNASINYLLFIPFLGLQYFLNYHESRHIYQAQSEYFWTDGVGIIFLTVLSIISTFTILHSFIFQWKTKEEVRLVATHNASLVMFITMMTGALITQHIGLMWAFLEATTIFGSLLIYHNRNKEALEATWKYIFVCSIGISLAFVGILFLSIASNDAGHIELSISSMMQNANKLDPIWMKTCFILILTGFSVKMGVMPFFTVDIDAKDVAPSAIGALFSGGLMNVGFVAIFRFYEIFSSTSIHAWMNSLLMITGVSSIFFATVYILKVKHLKRLFAYSSVEHAGIALIALASGTIGYYAVILHLILHSFTKASIFFQISQIERVFHDRNIENIGGYFKHNPYGSLVLILGFLCVTAMPPSGLFISEFMTFKALISNGYMPLAISLFILLSFIFYAIGKDVFHVLFFLPMRSSAVYFDKIHPLESLSQIAMLLAVIYVGINPPAFLEEVIKFAIKDLK